MFAETFIRRPVAMYLLTLGVLLLGIVAYGRLPVSSLPDVAFPVIRVSASLPGASPETMASSVATPLERQFSTISAVNEMTSINTVGNTSVILQFALDRDIDGAARDVEAAINAAEANLPADLPSPPTYFKANPNAFPVLALALTSDTVSQGDIYDFADSVVAEKLSQIEGIAEVDLNGAEKTAVRVQVDPGKLASFGLSMEQVRSAISRATVNEPKGSLQGGGQAFAISADDQIFSADQYGAVVVAWNNGAPVRLRDLGTVIESVANNRLAAWFNGKPAVVIELRRQPNANIIQTVDRVRAVLPQFERWMPPGIKLAVTLDRTTSIRDSIANVRATMLLTIVLVVAVIGLFLRRFWATVIPSITIPVALAGTFAAMYPLGYSVDNLSLMALTISVGFVVDDAIVVIENISRLVEAGATPYEAAIKGTRQIGFTIISITASLISALIPILFMPNIIGRFFREFGMTLSVAVAISALVSLTLTPTMCAQLLRGPPAPGERPAEAKADTRLSRLARYWDGWFDQVSLGYGRSLNRALERRWLMLGVTLASVVLTIVLYILVPKGLLPTQDTGALRGQTQASPTISFKDMSIRQQEVMKVVSSDPAVEDVTSNIGATGFSAPNTGRLSVNLKPIDQRDASALQVADRLRPKLAKVNGIQAFLSPVQDAGFGARASNARYQYTIRGPDLDALAKFVDQVMKRMRTIHGVADVNSDRQGTGLGLNLVIDRDAAARLGVSVESIDQTLYDAFGQRQVATNYEELNQYKVVLEALPSMQLDETALHHIFVPGTGGQVPLSAVAKIVTVATPTAVSHQSILPAITISFNTTDGVSIGTAMDDIDKMMAGVVFPEGVSAGFAGDALQARQSNGQQPLLLLAAIIAVYIVLGVLYESYVHPLTILSTIPSAGLGALLALLITNTALTTIALIGIIMLIGIVKKNAILMVDFALDAERNQGMTPKQAIVQAARLRFRPIIMTTCAAVLGALPLALGVGAGSELRQPLGITVVGGLLVSQILTLYTTPVIYLAVDRLRGRRSGRLRQAFAGE